MDSGNVMVGALIFILLVVGANFVMFAIARGAARGGRSDWMTALKQGLSKPLDSQANKSMDELRQKMEELKKDSNKEG